MGEMMEERQEYPSTMLGGRYKIVRSFQGGMGTVFCCLDSSDNNHIIAVKTLLLELTSNHDARRRFLKEAGIWISLGSHPNIVTAHRVEHFGQGIFIVMDYVRGEEGYTDASLRSRLVPGRETPVEESLEICLQVARAMRYVSEKLPGFVHCDLKPENILIDNNGIAHVTDFGISKVYTAISRDLKDRKNSTWLHPNLLTRGAIGTPAYMSPEQWIGNVELDSRSDIFALGCILYELLSGTQYANCAKGRSSWDPFFTLDGIIMPDELKTFLSWCLEPDRIGRHRNWDILLGRLEKVFSSLFIEPCETGNADQTSQTCASEVHQKIKSYLAIADGYQEIGEIHNAITFYNKVRDLGSAINDNLLVFDAVSSSANCLLKNPCRENIETALSELSKSLLVARKINDPKREAIALSSLSRARLLAADFDAALALAERAVSLISKGAASIGDCCYFDLANVYMAIGNFERALELLTTAWKLNSLLGDRRNEAKILATLGAAHRGLGDMKRAVDYSTRACEIFIALADKFSLALELIAQGHNYTLIGDNSSASRVLHESLRIGCELGNDTLVGNAAYSIACIFLEAGEINDALPLAQKACEAYAKLGREDWIRDANILISDIVKKLDLPEE